MCQRVKMKTSLLMINQYIKISHSHTISYVYFRVWNHPNHYPTKPLYCNDAAKLMIIKKWPSDTSCLRLYENGSDDNDNNDNNNSNDNHHNDNMMTFLYTNVATNNIQSNTFNKCRDKLLKLWICLHKTASAKPFQMTSICTVKGDRSFHHVDWFTEKFSGG